MPFVRPADLLRSISAVLCCAVGLAGCAHTGNTDALEAELREREEAQEELAAELARARDDLKVAQSDANALRAQLTENRQVAMTAEQADVFFRAEALKFNMLLTSGQDRDGKPGDDALSVLLMPVDAHGDLVKLAGEIEIELFDMALKPDQQRLGYWKFSIDEVREHWHKGFLSAGYLFRIDWQAPPVSSELTLHARMTVSDGRQFDATSQVKVTPPLVPPSRIAQVSHSETARPAARRKPGAPAAVKPPVPAGKAKVRLATPVSGSSPAPATPPAPRIRPAAGPGHAEPPTQTSDKWTDETIPTLR
jgi:outer membrane murein-binding lipoprotein Lpp